MLNGMFYRLRNLQSRDTSKSLFHGHFILALFLEMSKWWSVCNVFYVCCKQDPANQHDMTANLSLGLLPEAKQRIREVLAVLLTISVVCIVQTF